MCHLTQHSCICVYVCAAVHICRCTCVYIIGRSEVSLSCHSSGTIYLLNFFYLMCVYCVIYLICVFVRGREQVYSQLWCFVKVREHLSTVSSFLLWVLVIQLKLSDWTSTFTCWAISPTQLYFLRQDLLLAWDSSNRLAWISSEPQGFSCLCLPSAGITTLGLHTQLFFGTRAPSPLLAFLSGEYRLA